jgi:hypothetical protein
MFRELRVAILSVSISAGVIKGRHMNSDFAHPSFMRFPEFEFDATSLKFKDPLY